MNPNETEELMETIEVVRKRFGVTILLIEHDMKLVSGICEYLYVLNFGTPAGGGHAERSAEQSGSRQGLSGRIRKEETSYGNAGSQGYQRILRPDSCAA